MAVPLQYTQEQDIMDLNEDLKPFQMLGSENGDFAEQEESSSNIGGNNDLPAFIGHEDFSSAGVAGFSANEMRNKSRRLRFRQEQAYHYNHKRPLRMSGRATATSIGNYASHFSNFSNIRPKRILQNWERINTFQSAAAAEEALKTHQSCRWMKGNKSNTKEGRKEYYTCREGTSCPAQLHLLYDATSTKVYMFKNDSDHLHVGERKRGLSVQVEQMVRELYASGTKKPSQIQNYMVKKGMKEIQKSQLANFLQKLKKELGDFEYEGDSFYGDPASTAGGFQGEHRRSHEDVDSKNGSDIDMDLSGIAPLQFAATAYSPPPQQDSSSMEPNVMINFSGLTPSHTLLPERSAAGLQTPQTGNQSEIVSSSCGKKFYCRDESTEDGEHCLPHEENVKELILQHLRANYSNRDMLHIREELRTLKKEKKYPVLNRLISFTAGFLQDTFLEDHKAN